MPSWEFYIVTFVLLLLQSYPLSLYISYWLFSRFWVNFELDLSCIKVWRDEGSRQSLTLGSFSVCHRWREPPVQRAWYSQDSLFVMTEQSKVINVQPFQFSAGKQFSQERNLCQVASGFVGNALNFNFPFFSTLFLPYSFTDIEPTNCISISVYREQNLQKSILGLVLGVGHKMRFWSLVITESSWPWEPHRQHLLA